MKESFEKLWLVYKYLFLLFALVYWIVVITDDWVFIEKYWSTNWSEYVGIWVRYFFTYALILSFQFWIAYSSVLFAYHKYKAK